MSNWQTTAAAFDGLIQKPGMKEKLLNKPPFRFLHDVIVNTMNATGYALDAQLFAQHQMSSANVKEKNDKLAFLDRFIAFVSMGVGRMLEVKSLKIVAGLEPEQTNVLLQEFAGLVRGGGDAADIVRRVDAGADPTVDGGPGGGGGGGGDQEQEQEQQQQDPEPQREPEPEPQQEPEPEPQPEPDANHNANDDDRFRREAEEEVRRAEEEATARVRRKAERRDERSSESVAASSSSASSLWPVTRQVIEFPEPAPDEDFVARTQRLVGTLIQKPKMAPKLLNKPPFRFIHDIFTAIMRATGFPEGLFPPDMLNSANCKETKAKLAFLKTLIDCVSRANGCEPHLSKVVSPKKVAVGAEADKTNLLLQQLAIAAASGIDSQAVVSGEPGNTGGARSGHSGSDERELRQQQQQQEQDQERERNREQEERRAEQERQRRHDERERERERQEQDRNSGSHQQDGGPNPEAGSGRPRTARRAPPKVTGASDSQANQMDTEHSRAAGGVIREGAAVDDDVDDDDDDMDEPEPLDGFGNTIATGDAQQHGKLVRNIIKQQDAAKQQQQQQDKENEEQANRGGISFGRLGATKGARGSQSSSQQEQVEELRKQIQSLCQAANPLGKCVEFVYDDIELMTKELKQWRQESESSDDRMADATSRTADTLQPLRDELAAVQAEQAAQERKTLALKAEIIRGDEQVLQLLQQHVTGVNS